MLYVSCSNQGGREYMEDYSMNGFIDKSQNIRFYSIFDGHGGSSVAEYCARNIKQKIKSNYHLKSKGNDRFMFNVFKSLDEDINALHTGSTATVVVVADNNKEIICANCGDSGAFLGFLNKFHILTSDHKVSDELQRLKNLGSPITKAPFDTYRINGLLNLSRSIGDHHLRKLGVIYNPFVTTIKKTKEMCFILLASDGLWDVFGYDEVHKIIVDSVFKKKHNPRIILNQLIREAQHRNSQDNISITLVFL